jgi:hypothetical protein
LVRLVYDTTDARIRQYDAQFQTFFYINPSTEPPTTSWIHPGMPDGQIHPEQQQALISAQQHQGGSAADFLNSASTDAPAYTGHEAQYGQQGQGDGQGQGNEQIAGTGERGLIGNMIGGMIGKQSVSLA